MTPAQQARKDQKRQSSPVRRFDAHRATAAGATRTPYVRVLDCGNLSEVSVAGLIGAGKFLPHGFELEMREENFVRQIVDPGVHEFSDEGFRRRRDGSTRKLDGIVRKCKHGHSYFHRGQERCTQCSFDARMRPLKERASVVALERLQDEETNGRKMAHAA